ncbi:Tfp pilus assembly protein FimT/FimU [Rhodoplanes azumiensis]|uniref:Tfp pilus assembly protein FimT/FimU n=1 Tax=Rhodoplanes azumiensis TaxID=1897628 RepID=A0ABW5ANB4_9BRAD
MEPQPTSPRARTERRRATAGFTLLEVVCVLALVAMLAAIVVPQVSRGTSGPRLDAYAVEIASVLKADRSAAIRARTAVAAVVDAPRRTIVGGAGGRVVRLPEDVTVDALLPQRCEGRPAMSTIGFLATGMSCGGTIRLSRPGRAVEVRVNWLTGGIDIVASAAP